MTLDTGVEADVTDHRRGARDEQMRDERGIADEIAGDEI